MKDNFSAEQVEWNLSSALVTEISTLLNSANRLYLNGNVVKAFWCLKSVKFRFVQSLSPEERTKLKNIEIDFYEKKKEKSPSGMGFYFEEYNELIMDYLDAYGYLIPKKKDSKRIS